MNLFFFYISIISLFVLARVWLKILDKFKMSLKLFFLNYYLLIFLFNYMDQQKAKAATLTLAPGLIPSRGHLALR